MEQCFRGTWVDVSAAEWAWHEAPYHASGAPDPPQFVLRVLTVSAVFLFSRCGAMRLEKMSHRFPRGIQPSIISRRGRYRSPAGTTATGIYAVLRNANTVRPVGRPALARWAVNQSATNPRAPAVILPSSWWRLGRAAIRLPEGRAIACLAGEAFPLFAVVSSPVADARAFCIAWPWPQIPPRLYHV